MEGNALRCRWRNCPSPGPFSDDKALFEHVNDTHNGRPGAHPDFVCRWEGCKTPVLQPGSITSRSQRAKHIIIHTDYRPYVCARAGCGAAFRRKDQHKKHLKVHWNDEVSGEELQGSAQADNEPVPCEACSKTFSRGAALKTHARLAHAGHEGWDNGHANAAPNLEHGGAEDGPRHGAFSLVVEDWSEDESGDRAKRASAGEDTPDKGWPDERDTRAKLHAAEERIRELEARQARLHAILRSDTY